MLNKYFKISAVLIIFMFVCSLSPTSSLAQFSDDWLEEDLSFDDQEEIDFVDDPVKDPYENLNRKTYKLNDWLMRWVADPVAKGYDFLIPRKVQKSVDNVFSLAQTPNRFFNCLFQKKFKGSGIEFSRLVINSTLGIGGLFDPAEHFFELEEQDEDFGQTLAVWGMDEGNYVMLPVLGPATTREVYGFVGNTAFNPFFWFGVYETEPEGVFEAFRYVRRVNNYSYKIRDTFKSLTEDAIDPYIALQHAYIQLRRNKVRE